MTRVTARAAPLPPDERRAAIVEATLPLLREHGRAVTTRQIAAAAGIAEGTIFGVFPDKETLIDSAVERAFDQGPALQQLRAIDRDASLEARITAAVTILVERITGVWALLSSLSATTRPAPFAQARPRVPFGSGAGGITQGLVELFAHDGDRLDVPPERAARMLGAVVFAGVHPLIAAPDPLTADEIVGLLLHGITTKDRPC